MNLKKQISLFFLLCFSISSTLLYPSTASFTPSAGATTSARPSVEDVFAGLAPQEIAEQVQMAQQLMQDLHEKGSPEEIQAFYQMLNETINSMSPQDLEDIMGIAKMVEPLISIPDQPLPTPETDSSASSSSSSSASTDTINVSFDVVEQFKNMISSIIDHIDSIFQKIHSSKDCSELADNKWSNKATFNNMKRQIAQLKNDRLAKKLTASTMSDDEKTLVKNLEKFKDLLKKHDITIKISDEFGLSTNLNTEKKDVKDVKNFLDAADDAIDTLMPSLEKFLQKYDPEALQMAKEAETITKKASKDAIDAAKRIPSADARPTSASSGYNPYKAQNYSGSDYGFAPEYYDENDMYGGLPRGQEAEDLKSSSSGSDAAKTNTAKTAESKKIEDDKKKSDDKSDTVFTRIQADLEGFVNDDYPKTHETNFIKFINDLATTYPDSLLISAGQAQPQKGLIDNSNPAEELAWIDSKGAYSHTGFKQYADKSLDTLRTDFTSEFSSLSKTLLDGRNDLYKLSETSLKNLQNNKDLAAISTRLSAYKTAFNTAVSKLNQAYAKNIPTAPVVAKNPVAVSNNVQSTTDRYTQEHEKFIDKLTKEVGNKITDLEDLIKGFKGRVNRAVKNKK